MTDPADYLAFALRETWTDKTTKKAQWCQPILTAGDGEGCGKIFKRDEIRFAISSTQYLARWATIKGIDLSNPTQGARNETHGRVPKIRQHNAKTAHGPSRSNKGEIKSGEGSKDR